MDWERPFIKSGGYLLVSTSFSNGFHFFLSGFSFTDSDEVIIFYSTLPIPPAHENWDIYLQLCMWVDYHMFLIATLVFTRLLHNKIYHLIELPFDWLMMQCLFVYLMNWFRVFCDSDLKWKTGGSEPASSIIPVLQANRLTKSASHLQERSSE